MLFGSCSTAACMSNRETCSSGSTGQAELRAMAAQQDHQHPGLFWTSREAGPKHKIVHVGESLEAPVVFSSSPRFCRISRFVYHPWSHAPGLGTYRCMPVHPSIQARSGPLADATQHSPSSCMPHPTPTSRFGIGIFLIESSSFWGPRPRAHARTRPETCRWRQRTCI
jgi:hypothetical protein